MDYATKLKSCGLPEDQSLAFMFTCCGRGYSWYRRRGNPWFDYHNVETKAFRQAFPNTPIFGFFGGGEIGLCHFPKFNSTEADEDMGVRYKKRKKKKLFHQFSTIIVLLSFL
ncbi:F-box only protein 22-like [Penaeus monodon]|uniref:F-box only protein 22-like n=1 Tax=Penaeus monodon TaxID=6687 RepID=UPI0018A70324|nr:F-box only protein 22-like [Penaeus monodon]